MLSARGSAGSCGEALAGQRGAWNARDEKLLVSYRDMYIREIDPIGEKTQALVATARRVCEIRFPVALRAPSADSETPIEDGAKRHV